MSYSGSNPAPDAEPAPSAGFNAQSQMGLAEVLQMCCLSRRSGQITFRSGESYGFVYIQHGRVLHAMCGVIEGEEAIYLMLSWPGGGFTLNEDILPHKKTIDLTWEQLLFEGARRADVGMLSNLAPISGPVKTAEPVANNRIKESQPKLTVTRPDLPPITHLLETEYTHVGRATGNEICLPYPSISSRHCIFILSGPDVVVRDLNSSNGTLVNGESIAEVILRPGDQIQIGVVEMRFEPGIKRPKLNTPAPAGQASSAPIEVPKSKMDLGLNSGTVKLPSLTPRTPPATDDSAFVKGQSAISYHSLAKPEEPKKGLPWTLIIIGTIVTLALLGAVYIFFAMPGSK